MLPITIPIFLFVACLAGLTVVLLVLGNLFNPGRSQPVKQMPYESGMDPVHDTRRRFGVHFYLLAICFLVFDVELLFLYPWAVTMPKPDRGTSQSAAMGVEDAGDTQTAEGTGSTVTVGPTVVVGPHAASHALRSSATCHQVAASTRPPGTFFGGIIFLGLLTLGLIYDWRKGVFQWRSTCRTTS